MLRKPKLCAKAVALRRKGFSYNEILERVPVGFTNTDPCMIKIMMRFFREVLNIPDDKFRIIVRINSKGNVNSAERYWSRITKVPRVNFRKPEIFSLKKNSRSIDKYPYGMCRIAAYDSLLRRKMLALIEEFSNRFDKKARRYF